MSSDEIGPLGKDRRTGGGGDLRLGASRDVCLPDPLVTAFRLSVVHVSLVSILDGTALNSCNQEDLRAQMSETVLFGKVKDPEIIVLNFRGQLQCWIGENDKVPSKPTRSSGT